MDSIEIKSAKEKFQQQIIHANIELEKLKEICPHENIKHGLFEWRIGSRYNALICVNCGKMVKNLDNEF